MLNNYMVALKQIKKGQGQCSSFKSKYDDWYAKAVIFAPFAVALIVQGIIMLIYSLTIDRHTPCGNYQLYNNYYNK